MGLDLISQLKHVAFPLMIILLIISLHTVKCVELEVGGKNGWATPPAKNDQFYNDWASKNRFQVNDTLHFQYQKDSVLAVTEEEYEKCRSAHPIFFSNNGDTVLILERPGLFYFISGVSGHCERGLKMIVKVLEPASPPPPPEDSSPISAAAAGFLLPEFAVPMLVTSLFAVIFM